MTATERAIEDSIKGGYEGIEKSDSSETICYECGGILLLDPEFWRCLGIARGWEKNELRNEPLEIWMRLIFHLEAKKSAEDFFISLEG